jgi:hypothetical protein
MLNERRRMSQADLPVSGASRGPRVIRPDRGRWSRIAWGAWLALMLLVCLCVFVPWTTWYPADQLDASWCMVLHWAYVHHLDFGNQIVFTYGPWGFILQGYDPATFDLAVGGWTLFAAAYFCGLVRLARRGGWPRWTAAVWLAVVTAALGLSAMQLPDTRMLALSWLLLVLHFHVDDRPVTATKLLLVAAMALAGLTKFSMMLMAVGVLAIISLDQALRRQVPARRQRWPWLLAAYAAATVGLWLAAGQSLGSLFHYLSHSWEIATGYAQGEGLSTPTEPWDVTWFWLGGGGLLAAAGLAHRDDIRRRLIRVGGMAIVLILVFKMGYVRHDLHEVTATAALAVFSLVYAGTIWPRLRHWMSKTLVAGLAVGCLYLNWHSSGVWGPWLEEQGNLWSRAIDLFPWRAYAAAQWVVGRPVLEETRQAELQRVRSTPLPPVHGSVDVYSFGQDVVLAAGLDYQPRPVFQSYLAYTPPLEQLNAQFLSSPQAPQNILLHIENIDDHYPSQEDGLSWPLLLSRYDLADARYHWLLLRRAAQAREFSIVPLANGTAPMRHFVDVPDSPDPIWVTIDVKLTPLGKLMQAVYKPPELLLAVQTPKGSQSLFRLIRSAAGGGFLLSPMVLDDGSFARLASSREMRDLRVSALGIDVGEGWGGNWAYEPHYAIRFSRLVFTQR